MNITILGAGKVGQALATGWLRAGHTILFGSRQPTGEKGMELLAAFDNQVQILETAAAVAAANVVVLAVPWIAAESVMKGVSNWSGKILIDAINPIGPGFQLAVDGGTSGAEQIQGWATGARVIKAFNTTGAENMLDPIYHGQATAMFISGDDPAAKAVVTQLAEDLGFAVADVGPLTTARYLESLAMVWIHLAIVQNQGRNIALQLVRR